MTISDFNPNMLARHDAWLEAWDFFRGGEYVTAPGRTIAKFPFLTAPDMNYDGMRTRSRFEEVPVQSYLWSHVRETVIGYNDRCARAVHAIPIFNACVEAYTSATLKVEPKRVREGVSPTWLAYWDDVDRRGTNIGAFVRQALTHALVFGFAMAVTDRPYFESNAPSRMHQRARGDRAYSYLVMPFDLVDYRFDPDTGKLAWIVLREMAPDLRDPGTAAPGAVWNYRVLYPWRWELYNKDDLSLTTGEHGCPDVPVSFLFARRSHEHRCAIDADSILACIVRGDRALLNQVSLLHEQIYKQCFSQTYIPVAETGQAPGAVDAGPETAIAYDGAAGTPIMLSPNADVIRVQLEAMLMQVSQIKEQVGLGRGRAESSKEERSADALLVESRNENNRIAMLAEAVEEFDRSLHRQVAAFEGEADPPLASYSRDVSLGGLDAKINRVLSLKNIGLPGDIVRRLLVPLIEEHMREMGETPDEIAEVRAAIDAADVAEDVAEDAPTDAPDGNEPV